MKKSSNPISRNMTLFSALVWTAASALWIWNIGTRGGYGMNVLAMAVSIVAAVVWWRRWWRYGKEKSDRGTERPPEW